MLAIACSRITIRNCPEGASGKAMCDIKALTVGPVIFVVLMRNARMCMGFFLQIQSKNMKTNTPLHWLHFVSLTYECWNKNIYFKSVK